MNYIYNPNELYHHGVKGQKWGVRRYQNVDGSYTSRGRKRHAEDATQDPVSTSAKKVASTKAAYKDAKKAYNKSFNKAYNHAIAAYSPIKKHRQANDARWDKAMNDAKKVNSTKAAYKQAKKENKTISKNLKAAYKTGRMVDDGISDVVGVRQKNGDILFVSKKQVGKLGLEGAERTTLKMIKEKTSANAKKKAVNLVTSNEKKVVKDIMKNYDMSDPNANEALSVLKDIQNSKR